MEARHLLAIATGLWLLRALYRIVRNLRTFPGVPKHWSLISPASILIRHVPTKKGISWDWGWQWAKNYTLFEEMGRTIISVVSSRVLKTPELIVSDPVLIRQIGQDRYTFPKPYSLANQVIQVLGPNVVAAEGDQWKHYRRIVGPAFTDKNHKLVWESTSDVMFGLFEKWNRDVAGAEEVSIDNFDEVTVLIALKVFCKAGFHLQTDWEDVEKPPPGYTMTFEHMLRTCMGNLAKKHFLPKWYLERSPAGRHALTAYDEVQRYIDSMIRERQTALATEERSDILSNLITAATTDKGEVQLNRTELVGNMFLLLVAGHETTAHTLSFSVARLALHPEEQDKLYNHIRSVVGDGRLPAYDDMHKLDRVLAFIYEVLRMHPIVGGFSKEAAKDAALQSSDGPIVIPKGTRIYINTVGIHYNPNFWPEPHVFNPDRFLQDYDKDNFIPFAVGARQCLGRKFSETESVAALCHLLLRYKIEVMDEPQYRTETAEERATRVLSWTTLVTLVPKRIPITFKLRKSEL